MEKNQGSLRIEPLAVILVQPQMGANIGSVARLMKNFGLSDLRLVNPRDGWPNPKATPLAAGADDILENLRVFNSLKEASCDLNHLVGTSARRHDIIKEFATPKGAVAALYSGACDGCKVGIAFGSERAGLTNEDLSLCESLVYIPTNPDFYSLNLSHAVGMFVYEWRMQAYKGEHHVLRTGHTGPATKDELHGFFEHLEAELLASGFLRNAQKRPGMVQNLRNIFQRSHLTEQEVRTLRGIIRSLVDGPKVRK